MRPFGPVVTLDGISSIVSGCPITGIAAAGGSISSGSPLPPAPSCGPVWAVLTATLIGLPNLAAKIVVFLLSGKSMRSTDGSAHTKIPSFVSRIATTAGPPFDGCVTSASGVLRA